MIRYSDAQLETLLDDIESDRCERKHSITGKIPDDVKQAICAFANDLPGHRQPGILFIGACDDGSPSGIAVTDRRLREFGGIPSEGHILPLPTMTVEKRHLKGSDMIVVSVMPSDMPPVRYKGRIWIRIGPRRAIASAQQERILNERRRHQDQPFDLYPYPRAQLDDLARVVFEHEYLPAAIAPDVLAANDRTYAERLASCRMIASPQDTTPTVLGLLTLGKRPQDFLPGAAIQFLRIDGVELSDAVSDEARIGGSLSEMLRRIEEKVAAHNRVAVDIASTPTHIRTWHYPPVALQQIIYNAVLHRTYESTHAPVRVHWFDDRVEVISPGGPYGNVTVENFGEPGITDYRNPHIAEVLKTLGFVQAFGRGIATARKALQEQGLPDADFQVSSSAVYCIMRRGNQP